MADPMLEYRIVPASAINPSYGRAVQRVLATAGRDLRLPSLGVRFVLEADKAPATWELLRVPDDDDPAKWDGNHTPAWVTPERPSVIYLHPMWAGSVVQTLLHEARHVWQYTRDPEAADPEHFREVYDANEADAVAYAKAGLGRLGLSERAIPNEMRRLRRAY